MCKSRCYKCYHKIKGTVFIKVEEGKRRFFCEKCFGSVMIDYDEEKDNAKKT